MYWFYQLERLKSISCFFFIIVSSIHLFYLFCLAKFYTNALFSIFVTGSTSCHALSFWCSTLGPANRHDLSFWVISVFYILNCIFFSSSFSGMKSWPCYISYVSSSIRSINFSTVDFFRLNFTSVFLVSC